MTWSQSSRSRALAAWLAIFLVLGGFVAWMGLRKDAAERPWAEAPDADRQVTHASEADPIDSPHSRPSVALGGELPATETTRRSQDVVPLAVPPPRAESVSEYLLRHVDLTAMAGGYRSVFVPALRYDVERAANDGHVNPDGKRLRSDQESRVQELLDAHNPTIVAEESETAEHAEAAFKEAARRGQYRLVQEVPAEPKDALAVRKAVLAELAAAHGEFRQGFWYQAISGGAHGGDIVLYFTRGDRPEFFRLLEHVRVLRDRRRAVLAEYFSRL
jgi:hypothetical protein